MSTYVLEPQGGVKSFYGKAKVNVNDDCSQTLMSYGTPVVRKDANGNLTRLYIGWTVTTGRHVRAFCGLSKMEYMALPYELNR